MVKAISVSELRELLAASVRDVALIDVREVAEYNLAHIAGSCSVPRRLIEFRVEGLVPWRGARVVVCDDDGVRAALAASTMESMGYVDVSVLSGGLNRWVTEGGGTEWGVNVPSKDFGEKVLLQQDVAEVEADELAAWMREGRKIVLLDSRTPEEHQRMCIPGSRSMPGAELGLRAWELAEPDTTVVVHCAGRTRSIIGAGTLRRLGLHNVYALKNGTMGWQLAGLELETGSQRLEMPQPGPETIAEAESRARAVAEAEGVRYVGVKGLRGAGPLPNPLPEGEGTGRAPLWGAGPSETVYRFDVRTEGEYAAGHIPGFAWAPGGQLVQAADNYVAVTGGTIVFACDGIVRSSMTASWFRQMGFEKVYVVEGGTSAWIAAGFPLDAGLPDGKPYGFDVARRRVEMMAPERAREFIGHEGPAVVFVGTSEEFARGHITGSKWVSRSWLEPRIEELASMSKPVVVTCADGVQSVLAGATLLDLGYAGTRVLAGGIEAWRAAGYAVSTGLEGVTEAPNDVLPVRRSYAAMLEYLRWEEQLGEKWA
jgi:rhodanese-related sulfurtransferase